jgi:hypothetical protein
MIQAARSGRQNIAEGSRAAAASSQTACTMLRAQASRNSSSITKITTATATFPNGNPTHPKPSPSAVSPQISGAPPLPIRLIRPI